MTINHTPRRRVRANNGGKENSTFRTQNFENSGNPTKLKHTYAMMWPK